jgi:hypothetical protein
MLLNFTAEERALLAEVDACIDIPRNTKPAVVRKIYDNLKALIAKMRGLAPVMEARGLRIKKTTKAEVRALAAQYPAGMSLEDIRHVRKMGYSRDTINALRLADITLRQVRYSGGGSAEDPEQLFRDDEGNIYPEAARTKSDHEASAKYHANCARKAQSLGAAAAHYHASDRHAYAAQHPEDTLASDRARTSSALLRPEDVS